MCREWVERYQVQVRVLGEWGRLPHGLRGAMARAVRRSRGNAKCVLNVCFAYSAKNEVERAIEEIQRGVKMGRIMRA